MTLTSAPFLRSHTRTVASSPAETMLRPSGVKATALIAASWLVSLYEGPSPSRSQNASVRSSPPAAIALPSGENARVRRAPWAPTSTRLKLLCSPASCQTSTRRSRETVASVFPSGLNATASRCATLADSEASARPVATSSTTMEASSDPLATILPSKLKAIARVTVPWPPRRRSCAPVGTSHRTDPPTPQAPPRIWPLGDSARASTGPPQSSSLRSTIPSERRHMRTV